MSALSLEFSLDGKVWYDYLYKNEVKVFTILKMYAKGLKTSF